MWACVINRDGESKTYIIVATDKLPLRLEPDPQIRAVPELLTHAETAARVAGRRVFVFINAAHVAPTPRRHSGRPALAHAARRHTVLIAAKEIGRASCRERCVSTCRSRRPPCHQKKKKSNSQ